MEIDWSAIDEGIKGPLKVLLAAGVDTFSSCEGGGYWRGHGYLRPIIVFNGDDNEGPRARQIVEHAGYIVFQLSRVYHQSNESIYWQIEFIGGAAHHRP